MSRGSAEAKGPAVTFGKGSERPAFLGKQVKSFREKEVRCVILKNIFTLQLFAFDFSHTYNLALISNYPKRR